MAILHGVAKELVGQVHELTLAVFEPNLRLGRRVGHRAGLLLILVRRASGAAFRRLQKGFFGQLGHCRLLWLVVRGAITSAATCRADRE